ncbi:serine/threonine-protein phosphatase [Acidobacteria bacterium AB60]|nr:serine/threonine-protein phosphatase [Acidobacteria bacterium AB60]
MLLRRTGLLVGPVLLAVFLCLMKLPCAGAEGGAQPGVMRGSIGDAVLVLSGPWRFHPGDDAAWARPEFDDTSWGTLDLTPPEGSYDPVVGSTGFVPGWTKHGYPKLAGYAWYRLKVVLGNNQSETQRLALTMPLDFDDAYQIFVNGEQVGAFGRFYGDGVTYYNSEPSSFALPAAMHGGTLTIAIRMWMDPSTPLVSEDTGGLHGPPILGESSAIETMLRLAWDSVNRTQIGNVMVLVFLALGLTLGFLLFGFDRRERAYLWLGFACCADFLNIGMVTLGYYRTIVPMMQETVLLDVLLVPTGLCLWAVFWAYWFELESKRRIAKIAFTLTALLMTGMALVRPPVLGTVIPLEATAWLVPLTAVLKLMPGVLILGIAILGMRKRAADGWLALAPIVLQIVRSYREELTVLGVPVILRLGPVTLTVGTVAALVMLAIVSVLMVRRFMRGQRESVLLRLEIEQARQVQNVLIPEAMPAIPGFAVESEYRPAQQVGGDFFQIIPAANSGVLVVIGDVSGKGTPAAMTVSLLVGSIRTLVPTTQSPGTILSVLNERMIGRSQGGFTTCLVLRVDADGAVTVANAGHLPPYLNGSEIDVSPGLPLGLVAGSYAEGTFWLREGERLTLVTDGVPEARNKAGELLGFERTAALAKESAEMVAKQAQEFGQTDDITVLTIRRVAAKAAPSMHVEALVPSPAGD